MGSIIRSRLCILPPLAGLTLENLLISEQLDNMRDHTSAFSIELVTAG